MAHGEYVLYWMQQAQRALQASRIVNTGDPVTDAFELARAYRLVGDVQRARGDSEGARSAWTSALAALPKSGAERPDELAERAVILERSGQTSDAQRLTGKLAAMGYLNLRLNAA